MIESANRCVFSRGTPCVAKGRGEKKLTAAKCRAFGGESITRVADDTKTITFRSPVLIRLSSTMARMGASSDEEDKVREEESGRTREREGERESC